MPPSSWRSTSCGLIARPDVGDRRRLQDAHATRVLVDRDLGCADAHLPEDRPFRVGARALGGDLAAPDQLASGEPEVADEELGVRVRLDVVGAGDLDELRANLLGGALDGEAGDRRRAARAGRAVVGRVARVGAADGDALGRETELLGRDLREGGPRALADLGRADEDDGVPVRLHADDRARDGMRAGGEQADGQPSPVQRLALAVPADCRGDLLDVPDEVGVERLAAGAELLARRAEVLAAHVERVEPGAARELVHLQLADPLEVGRAEGAVRAGGRGVRVDAGSVDAIRLPAVRARCGVAGGSGHPRAVVRVRARVEPALDLPSEQPPLGAHRRSHPAASSRGGASSPSTPRRGSGSAPAGRPFARARR